jgi:hypothetical protein
MRYFTPTPETLEELKATYRKLAQIHHPDRGGDLETMKAINIEYEKAFARLQAADTTEAKSSRAANEKAQEYINIIAALVKLAGLEIELVGMWIWIGGDTRQHKDALKAAGCYWAPKRQLWYWRPDEYKAGHSKQSMDWVRSKYGSFKITSDGREEEYRSKVIA